MKILIAVFLTLTSTVLLADPSKGNFAMADNPQNAAINTAIGVLVKTLNTESVPRDTVRGSCEYIGGSCNGAEISLFLNGQKVYASTLTNIGQFTIPKLRPTATYKFVIDWPKHKLTQTRQVSPGEFLQISFKKQD